MNSEIASQYYTYRKWNFGVGKVFKLLIISRLIISRLRMTVTVIR